MVGLSLNDSIAFAITSSGSISRKAAKWFRRSIHFFEFFLSGLLKPFASRIAHLHQMHGTFPSVMRWCGMNQDAAELREAAASARAFADILGSAELKRSFREMARRWEAEADECETREQESKFKRSRKRILPRTH